MEKVMSLLLGCILLCSGAFAQNAAEKAILKVLDEQTAAWNRGNIDHFMEGYWKNDSLMFIGKNGVTYGWQPTLNNYKRGYPDTAAMGQLAFTILQLKQLSPQYYFVVGKWHLTRSAGNLSGHYTLVFHKTKKGWVIVADHSS